MGALCPLGWSASHGSSVPLIKFQISPILSHLTSSGSKKKEHSICECHKSFALIQNMVWGLLHCPTPPAHWAVGQPNFVEESCQGVTSSKKANNYPGLHPIKGYQDYGPHFLRLWLESEDDHVAFASKDFKNKIIVWVLILTICLILKSGVRIPTFLVV